MNERQAARWAGTRNKGKKKYVLVNGVLAWGIAFAALFSLIEFVSQGFVSLNWMVIRFFVFASIGYIVSIMRWESNERKYAQIRADQPAQTPNKEAKA